MTWGNRLLHEYDDHLLGRGRVTGAVHDRRWLVQRGPGAVRVDSRSPAHVEAPTSRESKVGRRAEGRLTESAVACGSCSTASLRLERPDATGFLLASRLLFTDGSSRRGTRCGLGSGPVSVATATLAGNDPIPKQRPGRSTSPKSARSRRMLASGNPAVFPWLPRSPKADGDQPGIRNQSGDECRSRPGGGPTSHSRAVSRRD